MIDVRERLRQSNHIDKIEHVPSDELLLSYVPKATQHIVNFASRGILRPGNISTTVAPAGFGKSNFTEAIVSSSLNPYCDNLGINVEPSERPVLWIDGERTRDDISLGFQRIKKRVAIENNPELIEGDRFKNVHCYPFVTYPTREARIKELERLCRSLEPSLVVLDGAADFVRDVNSTAECVDFVALLVSLANEFDFGAMVTIHPNPGGGNDYKPRGVLGSELIRTSESMLLLKRAPDDRETRVLTMDFMHGKNRNQSDSLEHYFRWSEEDRMFTSCQYEATVKPVKADQQAKAFEAVLKGSRLAYKDLGQALVDGNYCKSIPTANRWIGINAGNGVIFLEGGTYGLTPF